jgi:type I restriction enzyme, S subunit
MSFARYPAYKDSGVAWLGGVPTHWDVAPLKTSIERIESGVSVNATDTPAEGDQLGVLKTSCVYSGKFDATENKAVVVQEYSRVACPVVNNTLIVSRMNTPELVGAAGVTTSDYPTLFLPDRLWQVFPRGVRTDFLHYWTLTGGYRAQVEMACAGTSSSMQNLGQDDFRSFIFARPETDEQAAIVTFLDHETAKIDALVAEQERLIELLKEKRQAVISHAVTKGLDPSVPMKDSGVEWLGEVPAHWSVSRLGHLFRNVDERGNDDLPVLSVSIHHGVSDGELDEAELERKVTRSDDRTKYKCVRVGDLVYNMMRAWQGGFGSVNVEGMVSPAYVVARPVTDCPTVFVEQLLRTPAAIEEMRRHSRGVTDFRLRLYWEEFKTLSVAVPPLEEAALICSYILSEDQRFFEVVNEAQRFISQLQERRTALISAAVSGQIDVRKVIPTVPA